jgi:hypothetical protein
MGLFVLCRTLLYLQIQVRQHKKRYGKTGCVHCALVVSALSYKFKPQEDLVVLRDLACK